MPAARSARRQSQADAILNILIAHHRASSAANHQQSTAIRRFYQAPFFKARLLVGTDGASILWIRIRHHAREAFLQEIIDEVTDEGRAVAASDHAWLTYKQVDAAGPLGLLA
jgi:hypothetical protein